MISRFTSRRRNSSTYICECCGKRTRETGDLESQLDLCAACYTAGQIDILFWDYSECFTPAQVADFTARKEATNYDTPQADTSALRTLYREMALIAFR